MNARYGRYERTSTRSNAARYGNTSACSPQSRRGAAGHPGHARVVERGERRVGGGIEQLPQEAARPSARRPRPNVITACSSGACTNTMAAPGVAAGLAIGRAADSSRHRVTRAPRARRTGAPAPSPTGPRRSAPGTRNPRPAGRAPVERRDEAAAEVDARHRLQVSGGSGARDRLEFGPPGLITRRAALTAERRRAAIRGST